MTQGFTTSNDVKSVSGTSNRITSTGGTTPVIDIDAAYVGQASLTTLGTVTTGVWTGTDVAAADGGTGRSSHTAYAVLCGGTTTTAAQQSIASVGTSGQILTSNGAAALPTFQTAAAGGGAWTYISTGTASASATIDITGLSSTYINYLVVITDIIPATDATTLYMLTSTDGVTYDTTSYAWGTTKSLMSAATSLITTGGAADTEIELSGGLLLGNASNETCSLDLTLCNFASSTYSKMMWNGNMQISTGFGYRFWGGGQREVAEVVTAVRFKMSAGNITSGTFKLYGLSAT